MADHFEWYGLGCNIILFVACAQGRCDAWVGRAIRAGESGSAKWYYQAVKWSLHARSGRTQGHFSSWTRNSSQFVVRSGQCIQLTHILQTEPIYPDGVASAPFVEEYLGILYEETDTPVSDLRKYRRPWSKARLLALKAPRVQRIRRL